MGNRFYLRTCTVVRNLVARRGGCPLKHEVGKMEEVEQIKTTRNVGNEISAQKEVREWKAR